MPASVPGQRLVDALARRLDVIPDDADRFRGATGRGEGRVFGGMLLGQAVVAAGRTVSGAAPHALHASFVRGARHGVPLAWHVERVRDGYQLILRRVEARQEDRIVFLATLSFVRPGTGLAHATPMPEAPPPDGLPDWEDVRVRIVGDPAARRPDGPLEVRECDPGDAVPAAGRAPRRRLWMRLRGTLPGDPLLHAAAIAFASDRGLLSTAARPHGLMWGARQGASLDHALWLHGAAAFDGWLLYASESPVAVAGRGFVQGAVWGPDGRRVASVAQEGLIRVAR
jgi:acyl-CoA thioesterase II